MKKVSRNFVSLFASDGLSRVFGFVATVCIARTLTVEGFGLIHYGLAFLTYAMLFTNPGLTTIGARVIARDPTNKRMVFEVLGLRVALSGIVMILCLCGLFVLPGEPVTKKIVFFYFISLIPFAFLLEFVFQGLEAMEYIGISRILQSGIYVLLLFLFFVHRPDIVVVPISYCIAYIVATAFLLCVFILRYRSIRLRFSLRFWQELLIVSTPVGLATIFNQAALTLPPVVLGIFFVKETVGIYSAAYKIIIMMLVIERVFHYVSFPLFSRQFASRPKKLGETFTLLARILYAITIPCAIGGIVLADRVIEIIYGAGYGSAVLVLRILLLFFAITPLNSIFGYGLVSIDRQKRFLVVIAITSAVNTVLIVVLSLLLGAPGAAAALVISEYAGIILMNKELKKVVEFANLKYCIKPLITAIIMGAVMLVLRCFSLWIVLVSGFVVYIVLAYFMKVFTREEITLFKRILTV